MLNKDVLSLIVIVGIIVLTRTVLHIAPNVELVTALSIAAGYYISNKKLAFSVPVIGLLLSDLIIGNTAIFVFTWSGFLIAPIAGLFLRKLKVNDLGKLAFGSQIAALTSTIIFFLWTNLGVVIVTNMYTKDIAGLMQSYVNALPFLSNQLIFNLMLTPVVFVAVRLWGETRKEKHLNY